MEIPLKDTSMSGKLSTSGVLFPRYSRRACNFCDLYAGATISPFNQNQSAATNTAVKYLVSLQNFYQFRLPGRAAIMSQTREQSTIRYATGENATKP